MFAMNSFSKLFSFAALSAVLLTGSFATPASASDWGGDRDGRSSYSYSFQRGIREGFRQGFRDGRSDAWSDRRSSRSRSFRRSNESPFDRGFQVGYERGYDRGYDSVSRSHRGHDRNDRWDDDDK